MKLLLVSAGKSAVQSGQVSADLFLDCRVMWNPYRDPVLGGLTGDSSEVQNWIRINNAALVGSFKQIISQAASTRSTRSSGRREPDGPLKVCCFCLAGVHRSRGMKNVLAAEFKQDGFDVEVI